MKNLLITISLAAVISGPAVAYDGDPNAAYRSALSDMRAESRQDRERTRQMFDRQRRMEDTYSRLNDRRSRQIEQQNLRQSIDRILD